MELEVKVSVTSLLDAFREIIREEIDNSLNNKLQYTDTQQKCQLKLLNMKDVCGEMRVSRGTINSLIKDGSLKSIKVRGKRFFERAALDEFIQNLTLSNHRRS